MPSPDIIYTLKLPRTSLYIPTKTFPLCSLSYPNNIKVQYFQICFSPFTWKYISSMLSTIFCLMRCSVLFPKALPSPTPGCISSFIICRAALHPRHLRFTHNNNKKEWFFHNLENDTDKMTRNGFFSLLSERLIVIFFSMNQYWAV